MDSADNANTAAVPSGLTDEEVAACRLLLVDDNEQNLELLQAYIEEIGCTTDTAVDGIDAIEAVGRQRPDLILLDVMMPRMSGFQVASKLKSDDATKGIPIVMVTALNEVGDVERAVESGADDFLTKPVNKLELLTRIRSLLRVSLLQKQLDETMSAVKKLRSGD